VSGDAHGLSLIRPEVLDSLQTSPVNRTFDSVYVRYSLLERVAAPTTSRSSLEQKSSLIENANSGVSFSSPI
jgi:hypothetical protein